REGRHMIMILGPKAEKKSFAEKSLERKELGASKTADSQPDDDSENVENAPATEPKPQPKKKVRRESENLI
ncbi:MAG: hypothetical protein RSB91_04860, partial [Clostridia bacterium]